jgi:energy-coupling factor transporter ATP-binding protein EcfA2
MMKYDANTEAILINKVFAKHQVGFRIDPNMRWRETPAFVLFKLEKKMREDIAKIDGLRNNIEHVLHNYRYKHSMVDDAARTFVRVNLQPFQLEVNLPQPGILPYRPMEIAVHSALCGVCYGVRQDSFVLWQPNDSAQPHVLIAGTTGSGKTTLLQTIVLSMCAATSPVDLRFQFVDYKNSPALRWLAKLPHVERMTTELDDSLKLLEGFYAEILRRKQGGEGPRQVLVIDELASFTTHTDKGYREQTTHLLHEIARLGREFSMHLICCTQKPTAQAIGEQLKNNLPVRLVGMVTSPEESKTATGIAQAGAHRLPGKGAFVYVNGGTVRRFQAPLIEDLAEQVRRVRSQWCNVSLPAATITATTTLPPALPSSEQQDADKIRAAWQSGKSQAEMIRILTGDPAANTGGHNRRRLMAALAVLDRGEPIATTTTPPAAPSRVNAFTFRGSSSVVKPL